MLILDRAELFACRSPNLSGEDVDGEDKEDKSILGEQGQIGYFSRAKNCEDNHEKLKKANRKNHKIDGRNMNFFVDLTGSINKCQVMPIHKVLEAKINKAEGSDEGTGDTEHGDQSEYQ